jgi:putative N6-adenine-specific DNA methylase
MSPRTSLAVRANCRSSRLTHSQFVALKTKDGIVDKLRDELGERPSVDRADPDVGIAVHLVQDKAAVYLDVGGSSLHERGWRVRSGPAPLRETLAAAVLRLSGWDRQHALVDPMCGSGTLAIEAAAWSRGLAPGLARTRFGFERWASYDSSLSAAMRDLRAQARAAAVRVGPAVLASDNDPNAVEAARANARAAGVELILEQRDVKRLAPPEQGTQIVCNPPYGERLTVDRGLYDDLAETLARLREHPAAVLAGAPSVARAIRRKPTRWWLLYNGPIECRLLVYS